MLYTDHACLQVNLRVEELVRTHAELREHGDAVERARETPPSCTAVENVASRTRHRASAAREPTAKPACRRSSSSLAASGAFALACTVGAPMRPSPMQANWKSTDGAHSEPVRGSVGRGRQGRLGDRPLAQLDWGGRRQSTAEVRLHGLPIIPLVEIPFGQPKEFLVADQSLHPRGEERGEGGREGLCPRFKEKDSE